MAEMHDMAETLKVAKAYVDKRRNTILVATADHGTGGLSIGAAGQYQWNVTTIRNIKATTPRIAERIIAKGDKWQTEWLELTAIELSATEAQGMQQLMDKSQALAQESAHKNTHAIVKNGVVKLALEIINDRTHTGWTTVGHTGEDVQIFSYGKDHENFFGNLDNTDIALRLFNYLPKNYSKQGKNK